MADRYTQAADRQLDIVLDNMPGALVYTDDELNIVVCNDRFRKRYPAALVGVRIEASNPPQRRRGHYNLMGGTND